MITVVGSEGGGPVVSFALAHGADPLTELVARGWAGTLSEVTGVLGDLTIRYAVTPAGVRPSPDLPGGPGLSRSEREGVRPRQRVAAYAVVVADAAVLLTQLSGTTGAGGRWNLPGGGLDPGESPTEAVLREVAEETGQVVDRVRLVDVMTQHWVGRSPRGAEDYHAVRLLHTARCTRPTRPVVHDVGGSTADARWVPLDGLGGVPVVASVPVALDAAGLEWARPPAQS